MKFNIKFPKNCFYSYIYLTATLICAFWMIGLFELLMTISNGNKVTNFALTLGYKFLNDFWTGILIGLLLLPLYLLFVTIKKQFGIVFFKTLFILLIFVQFALVSYSLKTLLNLGADLLGYSMKDISMTVSASASGAFSLISLWPIVVLPGIFLGIYYGFWKLVNERQTMAGGLILILLLGSLKIMYSDVSNTFYVNKMYFLTKDIIRSLNEKRELEAYSQSQRNDYPLLRPFEDTEDVLAPFINIKEEKPNIFIISVEGLGTEFINGNQYSGFTPYIDSLISNSLYWENFVSNSGRTFGILPTLMGSLPFGQDGFLEMTPPPSHISLISILKANGYTTSYFEGCQSSFDRKINFLEYNRIDRVVDQPKFGNEYVKIKENASGFSWGYPDREIFKKTLSEMDSVKQPRLDILLTQSIHDPFEFPLKGEYMSKVDSILSTNHLFGVERDAIRKHKEIYASILYSDNSVKYFMQEYAKRPEFRNTIFIITGDHRLIPIAQKDKLCRYHVPLIIYSPLLKKAEKFKSISSHLDITPSILSFLMNNYKMNKLDQVAWMSKGLDTAKQFRNIHQIPMMRYKGMISDFIYKEYLLSEGELYKINEDFGSYKVVEEELIKIVSDSLKEFKKVNAYVTQKNRIFPDSLNVYTNPSIKFSDEELLAIKELTNDLNFDEIFQTARKFAFNKEYIKAILLCDYILNELPGHADARTLKGRTLAWGKEYEKAEEVLLNVIRRSPYYSDSYLALFDLFWWSGQDEKSISLMEKAVENKINNPEVSFKMAKAFKRMNKMASAHKLMDSIIELHPNNSDYLTFKQSLEQ